MRSVREELVIVLKMRVFYTHFLLCRDWFEMKEEEGVWLNYAELIRPMYCVLLLLLFYSN